MIPTQRRNSENLKSLRLGQIAKLVDGEVIGDADLVITGVAGIKEAKKGDITFVSNVKYLPFLENTEASAVITSRDISFDSKALLRTSNPSLAFTQVISLFTLSSAAARPVGIHPTAVIGKNVRMGEGVFIGPHVVLEDNVVVGERSAIDANTFIGKDSTIGMDVRVYPNVTIREETEIGNKVIIHSGTVIGGDGFGYETINGEHFKIPQTGSVKIEDDVEIGANVCIDRGRFKKTWIKKGTKIDNLVQIAHNVVVGANSIIISQAGISGSSEVGNNVVIAGQAGLVGHITLEDGVIVGAQAGVTKSVPANSVILGSPAKPLTEQKRLFALISRLPELFKEIAEIKKKLK